MAADEVMRSLFYSIIITCGGYLGIKVWNAVIMPEQLRKPVAMFIWLQSGIYALFMTGLFLLRLWQPSQALLWLNTALIGTQAAITLLVVFRVSRLRQARSLILAIIIVLTVLVIGA